MASIGRYVDATLLGQGGMGAVYRARDPELDRPVAIKVMLHASPDYVARFRREAQSIARLAHANIVQIYDFGLDPEGNPYFVMELIDGTPLDEVVRQRGPLPPGDVARFGQQAAAGLAAAHRAGIVHRDVKPSNLIIDGSGHLKIVDFGIARVTDASAQLTNAAALMGTPGYMAPEQASGKKVDGRADIYALGMTLFELCAGGPAFTATDPIALVVANMTEPLPDLRSRAPGVPEDLAQLIAQMAAKDPAARVQTCEAVGAALSEIEALLRSDTAAHLRRTDPSGPGAQGAVPPTNVHGDRAAALAAGLQPLAIPAGPRRSPLVIAAVAAAVVLIVGAGAVLTLRPKAADPGTGPADPRSGQTGQGQTDSRQALGQTGDSHQAQTGQAQTGQAQTGQAQTASTHPQTGDPAIEQHAAHLSAKAAGPLRVAVLKFKNVGADPKLGLLELGIGETAVNAMAQAGGGVTLVERGDLESDIGEIDRAEDSHFDRATVAKKGQLEGVQMAVQGGFQRAGKLVRITARFVRVENGEIMDTLTVTRPARDLFGAQDEVARGLTQKLLALAALEKVK